MSEDILKQIKATLRLLEQEIPEDETVKRENPEAPQDNEPENKAEDSLQTAEVPVTKNLKSILRRLKDEIDELENEVIASDIEEKVKKLRALLRKGKDADEDYDDMDVEGDEDGTKRLEAGNPGLDKSIEDLIKKHKRLRDDEPVEDVDVEGDEEETKSLKAGVDDIRKKVQALLNKRLRDDEPTEGAVGSEEDEEETKRALRRALRRLRDEEPIEDEETEDDNLLKRIAKRLRDEEPVEDVEEDEISDEEVKALKSLLKRTRRKKK